jgi:steroid delta-isomerase-like uncharacterized protein
MARARTPNTTLEKEARMPTPHETLSSAVAAWNAGDLDGYLRLYADDVQLHGYAPAPMGRAEATAFYRESFAAFDGPQLDLHEVLWPDDQVCVIRFTMRGRHVAPYLGVPPTGAEIALEGITILHFTGGHVTERFSQADMLGLLVQLGAVPAPA